MYEQFYDPAAHFPDEAARVGRHLLRLLGPDIRDGNFDPATYMFGTGTGDTIQTVDLSVNPVTRNKLAHPMARTLFVTGGHRFMDVRYLAQFSGSPDHLPGRTLAVNNHENWITGEWQQDALSGDTARPLDAEQVRADVADILRLEDHHRVDSLESHSFLPSREANAVITHMRSLLRGKSTGDYAWGSPLKDGGWLDALATKGNGPLRGIIRRDAGQGSSATPWILKWSAGEEFGKRTLGSGAVAYQNEPPTAITYSDISPTLRAEDGDPGAYDARRDRLKPIPLPPSARLDLIDLVRSSVVPVTELPRT